MTAIVGGVSRRVADLLLTLVAVLGGTCLVVTLLGPLVGVHLVFFRSGSMAPTIPTGSIALVHAVDVDDVRAGQVVSVREPGGSRVTHRVVRRDGDALVLRGDANDAPDPATYHVRTADRLLLHLPLVGYLAGWSTTPLGAAALAGLVLLLLGIATRRRPGTPTRRLETSHPGRQGRPDRARVATGAIGVGIVVVGLTVAVPTAARPAWAAGWEDTATLGASFTADTVPPSTVSCGTLAVLSTTLTWSPVAGATGYKVHSGVGGNTVSTVGPGTLSQTLTSVGSGTFYVEALHAFPSTTWTSAASNSKAYTVVAGLPGTCS